MFFLSILLETALNLLKKKSFYLSFCLIIVVWVFVQFIYVKLVASGDQGLYLSNITDGSRSNIFERTNFTYFLYSRLQLIAPGPLSTLFFPLTSLFLLYYSLKPFINSFKSVILICVLCPHFWIWQCIASKEAVAIPFALFIVYYSAKSLSFKHLHFLSHCSAFISFIIFSLMRPHYSIPYGVLLLCSFPPIRNFLYRCFSVQRASSIVYFTFTCYVSVSLIILLLFTSQIQLFFQYVVATSSDMFFAYQDANTTRYYINLDSLPSFLGTLWWGLPIAYVGFTPLEALSSPKYIPILLEGVFYSCVSFQLYKNLFRPSYFHSFPYLRFVLIFIVLPSLFIALLFHFPFGIFNPCSAVRYKQTLYPLFVLFPLYLHLHLSTFISRSSKTFLTSSST